jgi:hypothetical protein
MILAQLYYINHSSSNIYVSKSDISPMSFSIYSHKIYTNDPTKRSMMKTVQLPIIGGVVNIVIDSSHVNGTMDRT